MKTLNLLTLTFLTALLSTSVHAEKFNNEIDALDYCLSVGDVTKASVQEVKKGLSFERQRKLIITDEEISAKSLELIIKSINYAEKNIKLFLDISSTHVSSISTYTCMKQNYSPKNNLAKNKQTL